MKREIPLNLPLLDYLDRQYRIGDDQPFAGYSCLFVQHLLGSNVPLIRALERGGIKRDEIMIVGKAYSSHPAVMKYLAGEGYKFWNAINGYSPSIPYDSILTNVIRAALLQLFDLGDKPALLLDDAGKGLKILNEEFSEKAHLFKGVELTTRGARSLELVRLQCPVINVARSWAKTNREAPIIAESMIAEMLRAIGIWTPYFSIVNRRVILIGYGSIGREVSRILIENGFDVLVVENSPERLQRARRDYRVVGTLEDGLCSAGLVIGCTGNCVLSETDVRKLLPGALLINMASSDLEFAIWRFHERISVVYERPQVEDQPELFADQHIPWRSLYRIDLDETSFFVANGGFTIDFSGSIDPIEPSKIQLTRALLLAGALQAVRSNRTGLQDLDDDIQTAIVSEFERSQNPHAKEA